MKARALLLAIVAAAALVAAGCGSNDSSSSDTAPTDEWADGLCSSISTWRSSLTTIVSDLQAGSLTKDALSDAVDDAKAATDDFTTSLGELGAPDTEAGQQAKASVDELRSEIEADVTTIEDAVAGASGVAGVLSAVQVVKSTITDAVSQVSTTLTSFQDIDAKGEIEDAFRNAESCQALTGG